jgi:hypothetical protein
MNENGRKEIINAPQQASGRRIKTTRKGLNGGNLKLIGQRDLNEPLSNFKSRPRDSINEAVGANSLTFWSSML